MVVRDQPTVINEAISTGVVRIELLGDKDVARTHTHEARKLTAQLRAMYGVTERIANGDSGGFYQHTVELQDGTTMIATTNDGQDSVSILGLGGAVEEVVEKDLAQVVEDLNYKPSVWVGARKLSGGVSANTGESNSKIHLCVWEPVDEAKTDSGDNVLIVSNRDTLFDTIDQDGNLVDSLPFRDSVRDDRGKFPLGWVEDFPEELSKLEVFTDFTDDDGIFWDVVIKTADAKTPYVGRYDVRLMVKGEDCVETTPVDVEIKAIVFDTAGTRTVEKTSQQTLDEMTDYKKVIFPKGWFGGGEDFTQSPDACEACGAAVPDDGDNPFSAQWWQGGFVMRVSQPTGGPAPDFEFLGSGVVESEGSDNGPEIGFDYTGEFPDRIDRGCSDCETTLSLYVYKTGGTNLPTPQRQTERPSGTFPADLTCTLGIPEYWFRGKIVVRKWESTGLTAEIFNAIGFPDTVLARSLTTRNPVTFDVWPAGEPLTAEFNDLQPPLDERVDISTLSGVCLPVNFWIADVNDTTEWGDASLFDIGVLMPLGFLKNEAILYQYRYDTKNGKLVAGSFELLDIDRAEFIAMSQANKARQSCSEKFEVLG